MVDPDYVATDYWTSGYSETITVDFKYTSGVIPSVSKVAFSAGFLCDIFGKSFVESKTFGSGSLIWYEGALISANGLTFAATQRLKPTSGRLSATSTVIAASTQKIVFPGINFNAKSTVLSAGSYSIIVGGKIESTSRMIGYGRPYWEVTSPASGTWTIIVPQAEGTGK